MDDRRTCRSNNNSYRGVSGIIMASIITRSKEQKQSITSTTCMQHAGVTTSINNIETLLSEVRQDVKTLLTRKEEEETQ